MVISEMVLSGFSSEACGFSCNLELTNFMFVQTNGSNSCAQLTVGCSLQGMIQASASDLSSYEVRL